MYGKLTNRSPLSLCYSAYQRQSGLVFGTPCMLTITRFQVFVASASLSDTTEQPAPIKAIFVGFLFIISKRSRDALSALHWKEKKKVLNSRLSQAWDTSCQILWLYSISNFIFPCFKLITVSYITDKTRQ